MKKLFILAISCIPIPLLPAAASAAVANYEEGQSKLVDAINKNPCLHQLLTGSKWASVVSGSVANCSLSRYLIPFFIHKYGINTQEIYHPGRFTSFNQFFTRRLKHDARPFTHDTQAIISPADGAIHVIKNIGENTRFPVKGATLSLSKLVGEEKPTGTENLTHLFAGGTAFVVRLAPWDYHRMHFPVDGTPSHATVIQGRYESVHPSAFSPLLQPLEVNERHVALLATDHFGVIGLIPVGALFVGAIKETFKPGIPVRQGDELGYFEFGGSTIVLLFQKDTIEVAPEIIKNSAAGLETPVKMGQVIAKAKRVE